MKEKIKKDYPRRNRKLLERKICCRNIIERINTWAVSFERYSWPFSKKNLNKWTKEQENEWSWIKYDILEMTLIDSMYQENKEEEDLPASIQRLEDYMQKRGERQITVTRTLFFAYIIHPYRCIGIGHQWCFLWVHVGFRVLHHQIPSPKWPSCHWSNANSHPSC